jgi:hypothetical protein
MRLLHFTTLDFVPGTVICVDWDESTYWRQKTAGQRTPVLHETLRSQFNFLTSVSGVPQEAANQFLQLFNLVGQQLTYRAELLKEHIFEQVRITTRPQAPCRQRCMYFFDEALDPMIYAAKIGFDPNLCHLGGSP